MERLYIISYRIYLPNGGSYKYAFNPMYEDKIEYYKKSERDAFISSYKDLKKKEGEGIYIDNLKCLYVDIFNDITETMEDIIGAI